MTETSFSDEDIFLHLACRPRQFVEGAVSIDKSTKPLFTTIQRECQSSLGELDQLPLEILRELCIYLDLRSLCCLSYVSVRGNAVVESLQMYRTILKHAGYIFEILKQGKTLQYYPLVTLYNLLHSDKCSFCNAYGTFLRLISPQRGCLICITDNQANWMTSLPLAKDCFGLTTQQLNRLPIMWSIPGKYHLSRRTSRLRSIRLTSVQYAKELALKVHGSMNKLVENHPLNHYAARPFKLNILNHYREAPLHPLPHDPMAASGDRNAYMDHFGGMGVIPFPSVLRGGIEDGLWCRGCQLTFESFVIEGMDDKTLSRIVPQGYDKYHYLFLMQYRAWSKEEFLQHGRQCHSADAVISKRWIGLP
jgi:hypothetical protein